MGGHQTRTGVLAWNSRTLASGSRDRHILQHDLRISSDYVSKLVGHKSEVKSKAEELNKWLSSTIPELYFQYFV